MAGRPAALPLTVVTPLVGGLLAVVPAVTHDAVEVQHVAFGTALVLLGVGVLGVLIHVGAWLGRAKEDQERLLVKVDSWGALVDFLDGERAPVPITEGRRRRRCRRLRGVDAARGHAGPVSAASVGVVVAVALIAGAGHDRTGAPEAAPRTPPADRVPQAPLPTSPPPASPPTTSTVVPTRRPPTRPSARPVTVTKTVTATVTAPAATPRSAPPLLGLLAAPTDQPDPPPASPAAATSEPTSSTPPTLVRVAVGDG